MTIIVPSARSSSVGRTLLNGQNPAALYVLKRDEQYSHHFNTQNCFQYDRTGGCSLYSAGVTANQGISAILPLDSMVHTIQRTEGYSATTGRGMVFHTHPTYPCPSGISTEPLLWPPSAQHTL